MAQSAVKNFRKIICQPEAGIQFLNLLRSRLRRVFGIVHWKFTRHLKCFGQILAAGILRAPPGSTCGSPHLTLGAEKGAAEKMDEIFRPVAVTVAVKNAKTRPS